MSCHRFQLCAPPSPSASAFLLYCILCGPPFPHIPLASPPSLIWLSARPDNQLESRDVDVDLVFCWCWCCWQPRNPIRAEHGPPSRNCKREAKGAVEAAWNLAACLSAIALAPTARAFKISQFFRRFWFHFFFFASLFLVLVFGRLNFRQRYPSTMVDNVAS